MYSNPMFCIVLVFLLNILCYKHSIGNCIVLVMYSNPMQIPPLHLSCHRYYQLLWAKRQTTLPLSSSGKGRKKKRLLIKNFAQITKLVSFPSVSLLRLSDPSPIIGYACHSLTPYFLLVNLIYVSLTCEDGNSKLVEVLSATLWKLWRAFLDWNHIVKPFYSW